MRESASQFWHEARGSIALAERRFAEAIREFRASDTAKAVTNYRTFIALWKNAEPEFQPRVAEARRRLVQLTPVQKLR